MIQNIIFHTKANGKTEIHLEHSTGETTVLFFSSPFVAQAQHYYVEAISRLIETNKKLDPNEDLFNIFSQWFVQHNLEMPLGAWTINDTTEDRLRIGNRIREIREEQHLEAKSLAQKSGIDAANLSRIEKGRYSVGLDVLSKIAHALGYKIDFVKHN